TPLAYIRGLEGYLTAIAAPVTQYNTGATQAMNVGVVPPRARIRSHEIHTGSGRQAIQIEDFGAGDQVIRVRESVQAPLKLLRLKVPGEQQHIGSLTT
ncbi:hypothetical protein BIW11_01512, partial [Tropilaelaps mercedesae]